MQKRQMHLGVFLMGFGHHLASWRQADTPADSPEDIDFYIDIAKTAEQGKFDLLFVSDGLSFNERSHPSELVRFEPLTLLGALSIATKSIGLAATATTTYNEPFHLARKFLSLDHLNKGRTGWNVVTSYYQGEANNFNQNDHMKHDERYVRADEFVEVVKKLWNSWETDALVRDKATGTYFDQKKLHAQHHEGRYFSVAGPLNTSRSKQGEPVIIQAGSSEQGRAFAAKHAEVIFTAQQTIEEALKFANDIQSKAVEHGRDPSKVKILPGVIPIVALTEEEAWEKYNELQDLIVPEVGLELLSEYMGGFDFSQFDLDGPLPTELPEYNGNQSRKQLIIDMAKREQLTVRQLYQKIAGGRGHRLIIGNPEQVADDLQLWFESGACDGFNLLFARYPGGLDDFVELVVPILQERGIFRKQYSGETLRDHLGLDVPSFRTEKQVSNQTFV
ncbi:LLM class flavin-dependent oxidoreductase [Alkalicoccobacillus porphyridii]|uniref:LLM class flavin-dependent oxidoreductase n=1 Tax=Alkalicoccobacillus porphyridii TaxID=2597270 RepID=A0A554A2D2_9BACI|nr:LLM class flavin-dependent oxidoreductase [Alkalicoccobacillus porphyridii]TSB47854.1 LLM class flavin-dependent oxidoreductase [Alkalicoccobacillus porphyridii]